MEYISGILLAKYMRDISLYEIEILTNKLYDSISTLEPYYANAEFVFEEKVYSISARIREKGIEADWIVEVLK